MKAKLLCLVAAGALAVSLGVPTAARAADGAVVLHSCPDGLATGVHGGWAFTYCFDSTATPGGNATATFHGFILDPAPSHAVQVTGFECYPDNRHPTTDSRMVVNPSGEVNGVCWLR